MANLEEYELEYNLYIANSSLNNYIDTLDLRSLTESAEVLNEDFKETIKNYITKVITSMQNAWDKYKDNVAKNDFDKKKDDYTKAIASTDPKISIDNYVEYDNDFLSGISIRALDYNSMKSNLEDEKTFMKAYYSNFYTDENKDIYTNLKNRIGKDPVTKYEITKDDLNNMFAYMQNNSKFLDKLGNDLKVINTAAKNTDFLVSNVQRSSTTTESFIYEADEEPVNQISKPEANTTTDTNKSEEKNDETKEITKGIQTYFKCISGLLSAEMKLSREIYKFYNSVLENHLAAYKESNKEQKKEEPKENNAPNNTGTAQVNI